MKIVHQKQNIFFISDLHLSHKNVIRYDNRPFENLEEMHTQLIKNWNSVVGKDDIVYNLGDLSFGSDEITKWFLHSVNGQIRHVLGNHDNLEHILRFSSRISDVYEYGVEIWVDDTETDDRGGKRNHIIMSHYPILSWNRAHHGSWHLHGHSHGGLMKTNQDYYKRRVMDVGCNNIDYTPISYQQVKEIMLKRKVSGVDSHY